MSIHMLKYRIPTLISVLCYSFIIRRIIILSILYDNISNFTLHTNFKYKRDVLNRSTCFNSRQFAMMAEVYMNMSGQTCNHCNYINNNICTVDKCIPLSSLCCILLIYFMFPISYNFICKHKGYIIKYIVIESSK